jgi:hypothetical protein
LVAIVGTGVTIGLTNDNTLSWKGLIQSGFAYAQQKGKITAKQAKAWKPQLDSSDLDDTLSAAEFMGRKLDSPRGDLYARWLEHVFQPLVPANKPLEKSLAALRAAGIPICTLNYDTLMERVTGLPTVTLTDTVKVAAWVRRDSPGILHLHGSWNEPATCILGIRDYGTTVGDAVRDLIQRSLASFRRLLFIGCGATLADPNFSALLMWLRDNMKTAAPEHYALVADGDLAARHADPAWRGFVEPLGYGAAHASLPAWQNTFVKQYRHTRRKRTAPAGRPIQPPAMQNCSRTIAPSC